MLNAATEKLLKNVKTADYVSDRIIDLGKAELTINAAKEFMLKLYMKFGKEDGFKVKNDLKIFLFDYQTVMKDSELLA